ncbi:MAG: hypothetical protein WCC69_13125 [Pirellulales bacterium]
MARRFTVHCIHLVACVCALLGGFLSGGEPARAADDADRGGVMRVETELFAHVASAPASRSLTLFRDGVAWDFLELPARGDADADEPRMELAEIVLHDPARERIVVIDPKRNVKTQIESVQLERLGVSLAKWARSSDDRLIRWAGGPDFDSGLTEKDRVIELAGPRVRYAVTHAAAPSAASAAAYREFADSALLLRALVHPGGVPPFPRLALNRRIEEAGGIPTEVTLEIEPRLGPLGGRTERLKSVHKVLPRLLPSDLDRIETAESQAAAAEQVELAAFVDGDAVDSRAASVSR